MRCSYCAEISDTFDHVPPVSFAGWDKANAPMNKKVGVPACKECNTLLSNRLLMTVGERASYLARKYGKRYKKVLAFEDWDQEELEELGYNLKQSILASLVIKHSVALRIINCERVAIESPTLKDIWDAVEYDDGVPDS
jgi:hypothetical protein